MNGFFNRSLERIVQKRRERKKILELKKEMREQNLDGVILAMERNIKANEFDKIFKKISGKLIKSVIERNCTTVISENSHKLNQGILHIIFRTIQPHLKKSKYPDGEILHCLSLQIVSFMENVLFQTFK